MIPYYISKRSSKCNIFFISNCFSFGIFWLSRRQVFLRSNIIRVLRYNVFVNVFVFCCDTNWWSRFRLTITDATVISFNSFVVLSFVPLPMSAELNNNNLTHIGIDFINYLYLYEQILKKDCVSIQKCLVGNILLLVCIEIKVYGEN